MTYEQYIILQIPLALSIFFNIMFNYMYEENQLTVFKIIFTQSELMNTNSTPIQFLYRYVCA